MTDLAVRPASVSNIGSIAAVHRAAFRSFFLTQLGPSFLRGYYRTVLECPGGILLTAAQDGSIVGFVAGFVNPPRFYTLLRKRRMSLGLAALPWLSIHPAYLARAVWNYRLIREESRETDPEIAQIAELSSIAVDPEYQGSGTGDQLLSAFAVVARKQGANKIVLTTDTENNDAVNQFYVRAGFTLVGTIRRPYGRLLNEYSFSLDKVTSGTTTERM